MLSLQDILDCMGHDHNGNMFFEISSEKLIQPTLNNEQIFCGWALSEPLVLKTTQINDSRLKYHIWVKGSLCIKRKIFGIISLITFKKLIDKGYYSIGGRLATLVAFKPWIQSIQYYYFILVASHKSVFISSAVYIINRKVILNHYF